MIKRNVHLKGPVTISPWRKLSFGMWSGPYDGQVIADTEFRLATGDTKEASAQFAYAVSRAMSEFPQLNSTLRFQRFYERKNVDVFFHVAGSPEPDNLTGLIIRAAEGKTVKEIGQELRNGVRSIRLGGDPLFSGIKRKARLLPTFLMRPINKLLDFIMYDLNIWIPAVGMSRDPFGSIMITNMGALGFGRASVPLPRFGKVGLVFCMGKLENEVLQTSITFDHRRMDGAMAVEFGASIQKHLDDLRNQSFVDPRKERSIREEMAVRAWQ